LIKQMAVTAGKLLSIELPAAKDPVSFGVRTQ
jgi:hypothetical protein